MRMLLSTRVVLHLVAIFAADRVCEQRLTGLIKIVSMSITEYY